MLKGDEIIGKPVIAYDTGDRFERVEDIIFDPDNNKVIGYLLEEGGVFSDARALLLQDVRATGPDAIIVPSKSVVVHADKVPELKNIIERGNVLKGRRIMTTDGDDLGTARDLYFDEKIGTVEGYEVSGGLFADAYTGRSFVPAEEALKIGADVAFVTPKTRDLMEEQVGGLKGGFQAAGERIGEAAVGAGESLQQAGRTAGEKMGGAMESVQARATMAAVSPEEQKDYVIGKTAGEDVVAPDGSMIVQNGEQVTRSQAEQAERQGMLYRLYQVTGGSLVGGVAGRMGRATAEQTVEQARGRRAQRTVIAPDGLIVVAQGQIVNDVVIARARTYDKEQDLLQAVGMSPQQAAGGAAGAAAQAATERAAVGTRQMTESARGMFGRVQESIGGIQDRTLRDREERRVKNALGRPVTRVILDRDDNVILNTGEIITNRAIREAQQAGILDILLDSVYEGQPQIPPEQLRAPEPGDASLRQEQ